jgi:serine/threonine protein kinase
MDVIDPRNAFQAGLPEQFGKYTLLGHLATGGMAEVWLARQLGMEGFEKIVVIKRARPELIDRETTRLFLDEARLVASLQHPNIAQVYEIGTVGGSYFFVMEYVDGADLCRLIEAAINKRHRIPLADALYIITHVCTALHYAHDKHDLDGRPLHIIHRDVSPSNVLISRDGTIKVCDFGVAKAHSRRAEPTERGVLKGKFSYMSPEQCQSKAIDRRSDVFSIGILLYELTTLSKLFRASSDFALLQNIAEAKFVPPALRVAEYPLELERIVMKALAKNPADRYQSAQALQLELEEFARERKLAMSSVRVARLMGSLFEKHNSGWIRAMRMHSDQFAATTPVPTGSGDVPARFARGSAPAAPGGDPRGEAVTASLAPVAPAGAGDAVSGSARTERVASHRSAALWLVGAAVAGMIAVAVSVADQTMVSTGDRAAASALAADVDRIASAFDASARSAHMRADSIATTPMLRAAIETDAATVNDLASSEIMLSANKGETLEIYQLRGGKPASLLRLPKTAQPLQLMTGRDTQIRSDGRDVTLVASAPISGYRVAVAGGLVISAPVDLTPVRRLLGDHALRASLTGLGSELVLITPRDGEAGSPVELTVPSSGEWRGGTAMLHATPKASVGLTWARPARNTSGALGALLLIGFVISLARRPHV